MKTSLARLLPAPHRLLSPVLLAFVLCSTMAAARADVADPATTGGASGAAALSIGTFDRDQADVSGCGCSFFQPDGPRGNGPLLLRVNADGTATMRLDGTLVSLRKTGENVIRRSKKTLTGGDKLLLTLRGAEAAASVNAALERSCRVADGCRQLTYRAVISASRGARRGAAQAWGLCSC